MELNIIPENKNFEIIQCRYKNCVLEAYSDNNENLDLEEVVSQDKKWTIVDNKLLWTTTYPKLGYSYRVHFRLLKKN